ncbi:MAG: glycosyltransferase family 4 protein [Chloroflexi bacterium]|nr:glycosyltransferase family 4 protein [Chloroflexota bacterium]
MKIVVFSERLEPPFDEGIKNTAWHLIRALRAGHEVAGLTTFAQGWPPDGIEPVSANKMLWGNALRRRIASFRPDMVLYIPTACATWPSFLRARILKRYAGGAPTTLISLQPRRYGPLARRLLPLLRPDHLVVAGESSRRALAALGCPADVIPPGIDVQRFVPVSAEERQSLRRRYDIASEKCVVLHVGHINAKRNVLRLVRLQECGHQVVVLGSTSTPQDEAIARTLENAGIRLVRHYVTDVETAYQMADVYVFPATGHTSAIEMPLSVLEALACDCPVVSTPYGDIPKRLGTSEGVRYVQTDEEMCASVDAFCRSRPMGMRSLVLPFAWEQTARALLALVRAPDQRSPEN